MRLLAFLSALLFFMESLLNTQQIFQQLLEKLSNWGEALILMLPNAAISLLIVIVFGLLAHLAQRLTRRTMDRFSQNLAVNRLLSKVIQGLVLLAGVFISLGVLQLRDTVMTLLAGMGIVGLALGFAFQDMAANFMSGIMIAVRRPFRIGDIIEANGYMGKVQLITLRTTVIRLFQGQDMIMPNKDLYQGPLKNYSTGVRRVDLPIGVSYGDNLDQVEQLLHRVLAKLPDIDHNQGIQVYFLEFGDSSINLEVRFWVDFTCQADFFAAKSNALKAIKSAFDEAEITIPFPIRSLDFGVKGGNKLPPFMQQQTGTLSANRN